MPDPRDTPAMRQYYRFKRQHPDCILLFRIGDFYEMFDDDAVAVSKAIGLTLTQRSEGVPMAGVPYHQLENYLRRLIDRGFRVAVCDQIQDAAEAKAGGGIVDRGVTRVLTPGTLVDDTLLPPDAARTLAAVCFLDSGDGPDGRVAAAVVDLSTGRFSVFDSTAGTVPDELARRQVGELLYAQTADGGAAPPRVKAVLDSLAISGSPQPPWHFRPDESREALLKQFGVSTLAGFGLREDDALARPAGAIIRYLQLTQMAAADQQNSNSTAPRTLRHLQPPRREDPAGLCLFDATALRSLEILRTIRAPSNQAQDLDGSLIGIFAPTRTFPGCRTAMGKRLLREWLCCPLSDLARISARQTCVSTLVEDRRTAQSLTDALDKVQDVARIAARLALARAGPRDLVALGRSLAQVHALAAAIDNAPAFAAHRESIASLAASLAPLSERIAAACIDTPPQHLREGGLVRDGVDPELDEARLLQKDAGEWMAQYQKSLIDEHSLPSLKVGFNKIFGYYIELPAAQARRAPAAFSRKQTLKNAERYITPQLKEFEDKVTTAQSRAVAREQAIFDELCSAAAGLIPAISAFADAVAELDALACFAEKAARRAWKKPEIVDAPTLTIHQGRHPVLDELLGSNFVPNDVELGSDEVTKGHSDEEISDGSSTPSLRHSVTPSLALITGPNMAGKSTFIRQTALLVLLAHCGSFIPADRATIGLTDRIFTRVGADDALHAGQSTFMVEMTETARILHHATARSLIILDEIGRGTSTLDGLSLAWAIAETLASGTSPRTLFATHYHELTDLEDLLPGRVANLHVAVREWGEEIVFLHRILPGRTDQSYGVHVAKLAGIPAPTITRAREVLESLAVHHVDGSSHARPPSPAAANNGQLSLFTEFVPHPAVNELREIKIDGLTPLQAFDELRRLKSMTEAL